jgi:hypothetical protein
LSTGTLKRINNDIITFHTYDTKFDSPGGPILELTNNKVIGIYAGNYKFQKEGLGIFLKEPINKMNKYNEFKTFKEIINGPGKIEIGNNGNQNNINNNKVIWPYMEFNYTIIKNKYPELIPYIFIYFEDFDEKKSKDFFKNGGLTKIKTELNELLGNEFSIVVNNIVFGSILTKIYVFYKKVQNYGKKTLNTIQNFLVQRKEEIKIIAKAIECIKSHSFKCIEGLKPSAVKFVNQKNLENPEVNEKIIKDFLEEKLNIKYDIKKNLSAEIKLSDMTLEKNPTEENACEIVKEIENLAKNEEIQLQKEINNILINEDFNDLLKINLENYFKESIFEFRINGLVSINNDYQREIYQSEKNKCPNIESKILFHSTKIEFAAKILTSNFIIGKDNWFGLGVYFSDQFDYVYFYYNKDYCQIPNINSSFSIVVSEVYYNKQKLKQIYNSDDYYVVLDQNPTEEEIKTKYLKKTVPKNSIHYIEVDCETFKAIDENGRVDGRKISENKYIGREYCITCKEQIYPLYGLNIQRVDYCVIWRDSNFINSYLWEEPLKKNKKLIKEMTGYNLYTESDTRSALKLVWRKRYNKIILITNVGENLEGRKYIDKVRKILGFNVMVLFFTNDFEHLKWIKDYPNSLFCADDFIIKLYVFNFNENGFREIRELIKDCYKFELPEPIEPFKYPLFEEYKQNGDNGFYQNIDCSEFKDFD